MERAEPVTEGSMLPQQGLAGGQPGDAWVTPMAVGDIFRGSVKAVLSLG